MASVNKVILIGHLGKKPELRTFQNGGQLATFSLATSESWTDKQTGEKKTATEWHNIVLNGRLAEIASQYLDKGSQIYLEGKLKTEKWQDQNGIERYTTKIHGSTLTMLGKSGNEQAGNSEQNSTKSAQPNNAHNATNAVDDNKWLDDEIPF